MERAAMAAGWTACRVAAKAVRDEWVRGKKEDKTDAGRGAPEDIKAKFREALDKKHQKQHLHETEDSAHGGSKAHGEHGKAAHDKTFRRKSG